MSLEALQVMKPRNTFKYVEQIHPATDQVLRVYPSVVVAAAFMQIGKSGIYSCCNSQQLIYVGFKWRFYNGPPLDCK